MLAVAMLSAALPALAQSGEHALGLAWGMSAKESADAGESAVLGRAFHERFGRSLDLDRLPVALGGEIHRTLYFGQDDRLLRVWVDFGHPGKRYWEANYLLDEALVKYGELKARTGGADRAATCREPELERVEEDGVTILHRRFERDQPVWSCRYEEGPTHIVITLRRLGDTEGRRFDVTYDARDHRAVATYQETHRYHPSLSR